VFAIADYIYQRYEFMKQMRMSVQDIKDEHKQSEGDPHVRAKLRQIRAEKGRQRMMSAVPSADVVVTNPTHFAVAMQYDGDSMAAPVVIAKGGDAVALRIREIANENKIPIVENPPLARALFATVDIDQEVPPEHYKAVAEVISYIMTLKRG
jgi:flagellar biosynthetic protein FlhB